jgi:hypothetical protein
MQRCCQWVRLGSVDLQHKVYVEERVVISQKGAFCGWFEVSGDTGVLRRRKTTKPVNHDNQCGGPDFRTGQQWNKSESEAPSGVRTCVSLPTSHRGD